MLWGPGRGRFRRSGTWFWSQIGTHGPRSRGDRRPESEPPANLFTVGDIFEGTFGGTPGFLGLKLFVILLFSSVQSNLSQTSTNQRPLVEKGIFPAFPNMTALQSGVLKIPS